MTSPLSAPLIPITQTHNPTARMMFSDVLRLSLPLNNNPISPPANIAKAFTIAPVIMLSIPCRYIKIRRLERISCLRFIA
jgi:hypothetical protein